MFYFLHKSQYVDFLDFLAAKVFSSPQKVGPHAHHRPVHRFPFNQQAIYLNDRQKLQSIPNKVLIFR